MKNKNINLFYNRAIDILKWIWYSVVRNKNRNRLGGNKMCFEYYESSINACIQYGDGDGVYELINKANNDRDISYKEWDSLYELSKPVLDMMEVE